MFRHEGPSRSVRKNAVLAAYLAAVAGFVNSGGFMIIGSFTSHVTGNVGRLGNDIATHDLPAAAFALLLVVSFFVGAFVASLILASEFRAKATAYGVALLIEGATIAAFVAIAAHNRDIGPRARDLQAAMLCFAMGMQNSLVTRLSGSIVRTTHLTGVITDLGIEAAHWLRWLRSAWRPDSQLTRPGPERATLLTTITVAFLFGSMAGASLSLNTDGGPMLLPAFAVLAASGYAFATAERSPRS
ncbi:MAG TPA: YoaK family protein [Polyangiales bacterium]|jgi:uncharacterized membrane protein YoaK (UPF0700 family)|nr:YoaK family protein [Polyangiales bacterium]